MARIPVHVAFAVALGLGLAVSPPVALAQSEDDDLLTAPVPKAPAEEPAAEPEPEPEPAPAKPLPAAPGGVKPAEEAGRTYAEQDRIKAVPRKAVLKRGRVELAAFAGLSLNDAYYQHLTAAGSIIYYPHDAFGLGVGADWLYAHHRTDNVDIVRQTLTSVPAVFELPDLFAHVDAYWIPVYGKVSLFDSFILHFDFYGTAGLGAATALGEGAQTRPAGNVGLGQRFFLGEWMALRWEIRDHLFLDTQSVNGTTQSDIQNYVLFTAGASFYLPPSFEYTYR